MDISRPLTCAPSATGLGAGVVIGVVAMGFDTYHEDFKTVSGTRVAYAWDMGWAPKVPPPGFTHGVEYTAAQLDAGAAPNFRDYEGEGTHSLGIAAGNGRATGNSQPAGLYVGIAPEATLLVCRTYTPMTDQWVLEGVQWVMNRATTLGMPCVCLVCYASGQGAHDGSYQLDKDLTTLTGAGRLIVAPMGDNAGGHTSTDPAGTSSLVNFTIPSYVESTTSPEYITIEAWYRIDSGPYSVRVISPTGITIPPVATNTTSTPLDTVDGTIKVYNGVIDSGEPGGRNRKQIKVEVYRNTTTSPHPAVGTWGVEFTGQGKLDAWIGKWFFNTTGKPTFVMPDPTVEISSPASGYGVIAVGNYAHRRCWIDRNNHQSCNGLLASDMGKRLASSSRGPRADGYTAPVVVGPGTTVSSWGRDAPTSNAYKVMDGQHYYRYGGSQGAAHAVGVLGLALEQDPTLTPDFARARLEYWAGLSGWQAPTAGEGWGAVRIV